MVNLLHSMKYSFMVTTLSLLPLLDYIRGQESCQALPKEPRGDTDTSCCDIGLTDGSLPIQLESANKITSIPSTCDELQQEDNAFCKCVMDKIHSFWPAFEEYLTREDVNESVLDINRVKARVQNVSTSITHDLTFTLTPNEVPKELDTSVKGNVSNIKLPRGLFQSIHNETDYVKVAVLVLDVGKVGLFKDPDQTGTMLDNVMVSVKVGGRQIAGLSDCVELTFSHGRLPQNVSGQCVFWDTKKGKRGGWNTSGCVTTLRDKETVCCCDHLTFFTLLMSPSLDVTVQMLLTIANVGCGISVVFSAFTIILYFALRFAYKKFKSNDTAKIHVNLTSSLLLLNLAYLLNRWIFSLGHLGLCKGIGGFTHYCLLCCFTWMAIEAFQLYLLVIKVTNIYMRHYMVKLCLVGWGFPALVVTITGSMNSYGKYTITDMANQPTLTLCWIDSAHLVVHYVTNCSYFGLILLFNTLILVVVAWKLFCLQHATAGKEEKIEAWKGGLTVLGLSCLLGATWGLAFFTYGAMSVPAVYLFTVLNSLQGLFIFIWFTILYYPKKDAATSTSGSGKNVEVTTASHGER
ncbi:adhesion G protein-coupled receptor G3 isoform X1 [Gopherus flavomarginatus]|uniref:adhesion G protein-coupled receptor G3 isoform X1 n=1 Tax=Gopherus flavomarginatus TaxID=286002 RepID=UPI0021CBDC3A|nr:adhesion G protein-coupled receptor G3 isoform X1 [Gopherus flavomarginatus]